MRRVAYVFVIVAVLAPQEGHAGAWLREKGAGFAATSATKSSGAPTATTIYLEYGLTEKTTLGASVDISDNATIGNGYIFATRSLGRTDRTWRSSWNIGLGADRSAIHLDPLIKGGLSFGRGIQIRDKYGWFAIDSTLQLGSGAAPNELKVDSTVGLGFTEQAKGMVQLFVTISDGEFSAKLAPSVLYTPKNSKLTFQAGIEIPSSGDGEPALKLGIWRDF